MLDFKLSKRLCTVATNVRNGAVVADIGTDHAYLPIYLVLSGKISKAIASDINVGPIERAKINIQKYSLEECIQTRVANGLDGIEEHLPNDIVICGMGGELIAKIIEDSLYVRNEKVRLILQPMTMVKELREYLSKGFSTIAENIVFEDGKIYQILTVQYDGAFHQMSNAELELGRINIESRGENFKLLLNSTIAKKKKRLDGLRLGGYNTAEIEKEIKELEKLK